MMRRGAPVRRCANVAQGSARCCGMATRLAPVVVAVLVVAGCGSQTTLYTGKHRPQKQSPAQQYIHKRESRLERDNEGPDNPPPGRPATWSYQVRGRAAGGSSFSAVLSLRADHVCWRFRGRGLPGTSGPASGPTIRIGAHGRSGPAVVVLGARFSPRGCIAVRPVVVNSIAAAPRLYYLSMRSSGSSAGRARAQL